MKVKLSLLALIVVLAGCSDSSSTSSTSPPVTSASISGAVTKGPVAGATVNVYQIDRSLESLQGDFVAGPIQTASDGSWSADIPLSVQRPLLVVATGGSYTDEATGTPVDVGTRNLSSFLTEGADTASISPLSETVVRSAQKFLAANSGSTLSEGVDEGVQKVTQVFGEGFDPLADLPDANGSTPESRKAAAILGGLSQLANDLSSGTDPLDTVLAISEDVTDGVIDGQSDGAPIQINVDDGALTTAVNSDAYLTAVTTFTSNPDNGDFADIASFKVTSATGTGGSIAPAEVVLFGGDTASFTLTPLTGYQINGVTGCAGTLTGSVFQTAALDAACTATASFSLIPYTVTVAPVTGGTASTDGGTVLHGQTLAVTFTEDMGFDLASVDGCGGSLNGLTYTTGAITADCTITPSYVLETRTVTLASNVGNVTFDPVGPTVDLDYGTVLEVTVTPDPGFVVDSVAGCGGSLNGDLFTTGSVTANCTITANVSAVPVYTVSTAITGQGQGSIDPTSIEVTQGNTAQFTLAPGANSSLSAVSGCNGTQSVETPLVYTTGAVTANCTVTAQFDPIYTITVNVGANGAVSPTPPLEALIGETPEITITPDSGYLIDTVGGTCGGTLNGNVYTVASVSGDCSVDILFVAEETGLPGAVWDQFNWDGANWQ